MTTHQLSEHRNEVLDEAIELIYALQLEPESTLARCINVGILAAVAKLEGLKDRRRDD